MPKASADSFKLASHFTVADYKKVFAEATAAANNGKTSEEEKSTAAIADAIQRRFRERYIEPVTVDGHKHGFTMMAVACLMIEALESFREGRATTPQRQGAATFVAFFYRSSRFLELKGFGKSFYGHVRCGILHQAETTGGWRINRTGPLFDSSSRTINATHFVKALDMHLSDYCAQLKSAKWDSKDWINVRMKMDSICRNCN